ncbi:MAG: DUF4105 domain-containing protein [Myxococcota bacterium]
MSLSLLLTLAAAPPTGPSISSASADYRDRLVQEAKARALHEERQWELLLHYRGRLFGGRKSEADGEGFFADPNGKFDPEAELAGTLEAFFESTPDEFHPQCRLAARYKWLNSVLRFDRSLMPQPYCQGLEKYLRVMDPDSATLIFASAYINAPPSMYGHTFLRINRRTAPNVPLLSHILNYSANPYTSNPLFYTVLGVTGGFKGHFEGMPYYMKIREYSDLESRDLWEYELDLDQDQLDTMLRHTWELDHTHFNYYFFDENCSYHLLSLLEVADPSLRLTDQFPAWVIPTDTLQAILQTEGLVRDRAYRPSHATKMATRADRLSGDELKAAKKMVQGEDESRFKALDGRAEDRQALILESAHDVFKYKNGFERAEGGDPELLAKARREAELLDRRSAIQITTEVTTVPEPRPPESGHGSARLGTSGGVTSDGDYVQEVEWRAAFHDFLDRQPGFVGNTELEMLAIALRVIPSQNESADVVILERVDALNILSATPWTRFAKPLSWRVNVGYRRVDDLGTHRWNNTAFELHGGPGLAFQSALFKKEVIYLFLDPQFEAGPAFDSRQTAIRFSGDAALGLGIDFTDWWRLAAEARVGYVLTGDPLDVLWQVRGGMNFALGRNFALRLRGGYFRRAEEAHAGLLFYY